MILCNFDILDLMEFICFEIKELDAMVACHGDEIKGQYGTITISHKQHIAEKVKSIRRHLAELSERIKKS